MPRRSIGLPRDRIAVATGEPAMAKHYFHLTNGEDLVVDREGARTRSRADIWLRARKVSEALMASAPGYRAWANWLVCVHDAAGRQVTVIPVMGPEGVPEAACRVVRLPVRDRWAMDGASYAQL
jgi:hypothetical protein